MTLLNVVLESPELTIDVKNFAIGGVGDLCLNCEIEFFEFLDKTMDSLIQAGVMSLKLNFQDCSEEERRNFIGLRTSLCEAFISIINGIKSPSDEDKKRTNADRIREHILNMFYYIESMLQDDDLDVTPELAVKVMDLYCDINHLSDNADSLNDPNEKLQAQKFT